MEKKHFLDGITEDSVKKMIPCFRPNVKHYHTGETIITYSSNDGEYMAILQNGKAKLEILNQDGDISLLEKYESGDLFGDLFSLPLDAYEYIVTAEERCTVIFIDFNHVVRPCSNACPHHSTLIANLFIMSAQKTQELSLHITILGQPNIRQKLLTYLMHIRSISPGDKNAVFTIPMSLSQLSEYLHVERTAMMRELRLMKQDGLIDSNRREFRLL